MDKLRQPEREREHFEGIIGGKLGKPANPALKSGNAVVTIELILGAK